jgi:peptidoglycan/xylan/chitin deacetylase (PgdA/CDA1 family)
VQSLNGTGGRRSGRQLVRAAMAAALPRRWFLVRGPVHGDGVCLTFDDGPHPENTPPLLDALKEHGVRATFFVIGRQAEQHPDLVRRMAAEGHVVGHHSYTHSEPAETSARQLDDEVRRTRELLSSLVGGESCLFRPPKGKVTAGKLWRLWRAKQTVVLWNADPKDYARASDAEVREWFRDHPLRAGDVVLMHDNHPHAARVVPDLVEAARRGGLRFVTIPEWLK